MGNMNIETFQKRLLDGDFDNPSAKTQIEAGWYDWFCRESSLQAKTRKLAGKLRVIANSSKIDKQTMYVWFKNNCPCDGSLYDDFRIADLATGDTIYCIVPSCGHRSTKGQASVWGRENGFSEALVEGKWKDVKAFFNN